MAYSKEQWDRARAYYESGQYSLAGIQEKTGISRSKISEKAKREQWEQGKNADYIEARKTLAVKKGTEKGTVIQVLDDIADEQIRREGLVFGVTESALKQLKKISDEGVKEVLVTSKLGQDTIVEKETINLTPQDYESIVSAADKASLTLGVNQRHAKSGDVNVNTQTNVGIQTVTRRIVRD